MTCGAAFKRKTAEAVLRLKVARECELSFCAPLARKNLRRIHIMELCEAKQPIVAASDIVMQPRKRDRND